MGVLAPGFELLFPPKANLEQFPSVWIAARIPYDAENRNNVQWRVIGRLKSGASLVDAQAEAETVAQKIRDENTISNTAGQYFQLVPMKQHLVDEVRPAILALMGAVIFLLLIACANVANLMLVRASSRERELAVRAALGAGWWQLVRQTLAEAFVIAALGTIIGVGLAYLGINQLLAIAPENLPRLNAIGIDTQVFAFSALAGLLSAVLFGIVPALRTAKPNLMETLRASGRTGALGAAGLRNAVVVVEVALAFVLLIGSGLMFRTFLNIQRVDMGFNPDGLLTFQLLGNVGQTPQERDNFKRQLREQLDALPGVNSVTASFPLPLAGGFSPVRWGGAEAQADPSKFQAADLQIVLPGYFEAMGTRLLAGRTFTHEDSTPDRNLLIVDAALAAKAFPNESAVGKRILFRVRTPEAQWGEIIGVVAHQRNTSLVEQGREQTLRHRWIRESSGCFVVGVADGWRSGCAFRLCARGRGQNGQGDLHQPTTTDGHARGPGPGADALFSFIDRRLLNDRGLTCRRRLVRRPRHFGSPANRGDRRTHGPRRRPLANLSLDGRQGPLPQRHRHRHRPNRRLRFDPRFREHARRSKTRQIRLRSCQWRRSSW